jgi:transcriptional regulator with XRE-family HTH domain
MDSKAERLATLVLELRGDLSQRQFAKKLGVSFSAVQSWEARMSWPGTENLRKLAKLKGWSFEDLQTYLEGEVPRRSLTVQQLLTEVRSLPFEDAVQVAKVALETIASKGESGGGIQLIS